MTTQNLNRNKERGIAWRARRESMGKNQRVLAKEVGTSQAQVSEWERGVVRVPARYQKPLATALGYASAFELMNAGDWGEATYEQTFRKTPDPIPAGDPPVVTFEQTFAKYLQPDPVFVTLTQGDTTVSVKIPGKLVDIFARVMAGAS